MKSILAASFILFASLSNAQHNLPHVKRENSTTQLIVDGKPFIVLGGELGNSSASDLKYMTAIWPKLVAMNLNTVLIPVYWELIEAEEGKFDFSLVDRFILDARKNNLKIIFLWFGAWKNSMSCYAPAWIKTNQERFPRARDKNGQSQEILSPFSNNNLQADMKAFTRLMQHIKDFDGQEQSVIMIQVENEIGMLPDARDHHPDATRAFHQAVPEKLIHYMKANRDILRPELKELWISHGEKDEGTWEEVFGSSLATDEIFIAWNYSAFVNQLIEAGKAIYPLPMFVNAALNRPDVKPGNYPSGGPLPHLMDIWKAGGPSIDFLSPDFYFPDIKHWCDLYTSQNDPLFIPEHRFDETVASKAIFVTGHYNCLGFSPFSIESSSQPENEPLGKAYRVLSQLGDMITGYQKEGTVDAVLLDKRNAASIIEMGNYQFTFKHDYTLGWSVHAKDDEWPLSAALIIKTGQNEYFIAGTGVVVTFAVLQPGTKRAGILQIDEGEMVNGKWIPGRRMNGDQSHQGRHLRIPVGDCQIQKLELYVYE
ncbi:MAG TPA: DUF5597 domain-containing protein [Bacteroidales bacterium]|nr:DUF5597 domain-containing protein [Bacteroidales bacterium]